MKQRLRAGWQFIVEVATTFYRTGCTHEGKTLAYASVLSLVPLLSVSFAIVKSLPWFDQFGAQVQAFVLSHFVADTANVVTQAIETFILKAERLPKISLVFLTYTSVMLVFNITRVFNKIWHVSRRDRRWLWFVVYAMMLTLMPVLIAGSIGVSAYVTSLVLAPVAEHVAVVVPLYLMLMPYAVSTLFFSVLYFVGPNCKVPWRSALIGGIFSAVVFELVKFGFSFYFGNFSNYRHIYGAMAAVPMFIIWIYVAWAIILMGSVISYVVTEHHKVKQAGRVVARQAARPAP